MDDCIEFKGAKDSGGYGKLKVNGKFIGAHRLAYRLYHGRLRASEQVRHKCDNPPCINPEHLEKGTGSDNIQDSVERGRHAYASKDACPEGHPYDEKNTYRGRGWRTCRKCNREAVRRYAARKKETS